MTEPEPDAWPDYRCGCGHALVSLLIPAAVLVAAVVVIVALT